MQILENVGEITYNNTVLVPGKKYINLGKMQLFLN